MDNLPKFKLDFNLDEEDTALLLRGIPTGDTEELTFLDAAGQWILEASRLIDDTFPNLTSKEKLTKKYLLMGKLLELKAQELS